jgi:D-arabinose 1-dehydrogenase-like Zn-dependent alcohol dehydrogenase
MTRRASRFVVGHEAYGTIVRLGTSFTHTSEGKPTGASKAWGAPRAYSDLKPGDKVRRSE